MSIQRTEMRNPLSMNLDKMSTEEMVKLVVTANYEAVRAAEEASAEIAKAVDAIADAFNGGHRLFYVGAGTSGRLGVLDGKSYSIMALEDAFIRAERGESVYKTAGISADDICEVILSE